jgi:hypothetical protein
MTDGTGGSSGASGPRYYGLYRGTVTDNQDPLKTGRIRARVPEVTGEADSEWAMLCVPFGIVSIPLVGAGVLIQFEQGDPDRPFVMGSVWNAPADTATVLLSPPYREVVIQTRGGHQMILEDAPGTGGITLRTATGQLIALLFNFLAVRSILFEDLGRHMRKVRIVVFDGDAGGITRAMMNNIIAHVTRIVCTDGGLRAGSPRFW